MGCQEISTKDDEFLSVEEARTELFETEFNVVFEDREAKIARYWAKLHDAQQDPEAARAGFFESMHNVIQEDREGKVIAHHKALNRNITMRNGKERSACHLVEDHGPQLSQADMDRLAKEKAQKNNHKNAKNSQFNSVEDMWAARHHFCAMHSEDMANIASTAKNGDVFPGTVNCANFVDTSIGVVHFADGRSPIEVTNVHFVFEFHDGQWYELTGYPTPKGR